MFIYVCKNAYHAVDLRAAVAAKQLVPEIDGDLRDQVVGGDVQRAEHVVAAVGAQLEDRDLLVQ